MHSGSAIRPAAPSPAHDQRPTPLRVESASVSPTAATILIVDDDRRFRRALATYLRKAGYTVETAAHSGGAIRALAARSFDVVFADVRMAGINGLALLREMHRRRPEASVVLMASHTSVPEVVATMRAGAHDYLVKPVSPPDVELLLGRILAMRTAQHEILPSREPRMPSRLLDSANPVVQRAIAIARQVAGSDAAVLLLGESG